MYGELPEIETTDGQKVQGFPVEIQRPHKLAVLRLPTNEEMIEHLSKQRSVSRDLGRRKSETESIPNPDADMALFKKIRLDKGPDFDAAEAAKALRLLTMHKVLPGVREGDGYRITLKTVFGDTVHLINIPMEADQALYQRTVLRPITLPHGQEEIRFPPEASIRLYDSAIESIDGYTPNITSKTVPPHHKAAVVFELMSCLRDL